MIALVLTIPANRAGAADADTCGVRLPRRISDADAFGHPIGSTISESFTPASSGPPDEAVGS